MATTTGWHTTFSEVMTGHVEQAGGPCRLALDVDVPEVLHPFVDVTAALGGRVSIAGLADDPHASGTLHIAPVRRKRIRYQLDFTATDGRRLRLDGWKSVSYARLLPSMTTLPATVTDASGAVLAEVLVRFYIGRHLPAMLRSFRLRSEPGAHSAGTDLAPRWDGKRGRLEAWYLTLSDPASGTGFWLHHELVAPTGGRPARSHGWATVFPPDEPPHTARFGPHPWQQPENAQVFATDSVTASPCHAAGRAADIDWDLHITATQATLFTFPKWAWRSALLPGAQVVPQPAATYSGTVRWRGRTLPLRAAPGATAHLYGHGNARRWAWLHADLGNGDVAEVVAAVSTNPGLRRLAPLPFVRLRIAGQEWPAGDTLLAALALHARIDLPTWLVWGRLGKHRIQIEVTQPAESTVALDYTDPDGSAAVCRNSERADAKIRLERRVGRNWEAVDFWQLDGTAHAEVGSRD